MYSERRLLDARRGISDLSTSRQSFSVFIRQSKSLKRPETDNNPNTMSVKSSDCLARMYAIVEN